MSQERGTVVSMTWNCLLEVTKMDEEGEGEWITAGRFNSTGKEDESWKLLAWGKGNYSRHTPRKRKWCGVKRMLQTQGVSIPVCQEMLLLFGTCKALLTTSCVFWYQSLLPLLKYCLVSTAILHGLSPSFSSLHCSGEDYRALPSTTSDQTTSLLLFRLSGSMNKPLIVCCFIPHWPCCCLLLTAATDALCYLLRAKAISQLISTQLLSSSKLTQTLWSQGTTSGHQVSCSGFTCLLPYLINLAHCRILVCIHYFQETVKL